MTTVTVTAPKGTLAENTLDLSDETVATLQQNGIGDWEKLSQASLGDLADMGFDLTHQSAIVGIMRKHSTRTET